MLEDEHGGIWAYPPDGVLSYYHPDKHVFEQGCVVNNAIKEVYNGVNKNYYIDNHKKCVALSGFGHRLHYVLRLEF